MNTYIQSMKNALTSYYNAAKTYEEKAAQAKQRYQPDVAEAVSYTHLVNSPTVSPVRSAACCALFRVSEDKVTPAL